jgi:hypothetical protein
MNPGTLIDLGPIIRAGRMLSSGEEKDDTIIDVDALLAETAEAEHERKQTRLVTEAKAQNVVNTLQKVSFVPVILWCHSDEVLP